MYTNCIKEFRVQFFLRKPVSKRMCKIQQVYGWYVKHVYVCTFVQTWYGCCMILGFRGQGYLRTTVYVCCVQEKRAFQLTE